MDFKKIVEERRSVRNYDSSREVIDEQLRQLFDLVKLSPSSYNLQPWEFIVVRDKESKKRLRKCALDQAHVEEASASIIVLGSTDPMDHAEDIFSDRVRKGYYSEEKKKETIAKVEKLASDRERSRIWAIRSTSLAAMTLMLAAESIGLKTCPMEGFDAEAVKHEFRIPEKYEVVMLITLGYESAPQKPRLKRYGFDEIVHFEKF